MTESSPTSDAPNGPTVPNGQAGATLTRVGVGIWTVIGGVILLSLVAAALAALSELMLPLVFAVMMGAVLRPVAVTLQRKVKPAISAMVIVVGSIVAVAGVTLLAVRAVVEETGELSDEIDEALDTMSTTTGSVELDAAALDDLRNAVASIAGMIGRGLLTGLLSGVGAVVGFISGSILGALILYYVLKDGPVIRSFLVRSLPERLRDEAESFISSSVQAVRGYWAGRSVMSASVTLVVVVVSVLMDLPLIATIGVVNFVGGFIPYIGAFIGGSLATLLAVSNGGIDQGLLMLAIVLAANLLLENLLEPRIMGDRLRIHPLVVLMATAAGGVVGGIMGLILAVPVTVVGFDLLRRIRRYAPPLSARATADQLRALARRDASLDHRER
jgi:predicted PurR-regulated permease PerM